jgi:hypothetical protein
VLRGPNCENCGREAAEETAAGGAFLCTRCRRRYGYAIAIHRAATLAAVVGIFVFMPPLVERAMGDRLAVPGAAPGLGARELVAFYLALVAGVVVHECAHALCVRLLGFRVLQVQFGSGPLVFRAKMAGCNVTVHAMPFAGRAVWRPGAEGATLRQRAMVAGAGPLSNLALAILFWLARTSEPAIMIPAAGANLLAAFGNLWPLPSVDVSKPPNDGWHVLKNLTGSHWATAFQRRGELWESVAEPLRCGRRAEAKAALLREIDQAGGDRPDAEALLCALLLEDEERQSDVAEGMTRCERLIHDQRAFPGWRALALGNRAWMLALHAHLRSSPGSMREAEWAAREARRHMRANAAADAALALVLARLDRLAEAEPLALAAVRHRERAMRTADGAVLAELRKGLGAMRCTLALIYARSGREEDASRELGDARALHPSCSLAAEVQALLAECPAVAAVAACPGSPPAPAWARPSPA